MLVSGTHEWFNFLSTKLSAHVGPFIYATDAVFEGGVRRMFRDSLMPGPICVPGKDLLRVWSDTPTFEGSHRASIFSAFGVWIMLFFTPHPRSHASSLTL